MDPQNNNDFPLNQIQSSNPDETGVGGRSTNTTGLNQVVGGDTFEPQVEPQQSTQMPPQPKWQTQTNQDINELYNKNEPINETTAAAQLPFKPAPPPISSGASPASPVVSNDQANQTSAQPISPLSEPAENVSPSAEITPPTQVDSTSAETPISAEKGTSATTQSVMSSAQIPEPSKVPSSNTLDLSGVQLGVSQPEVQPNYLQPQPAETTQSSTLPGAEQLSQAAGGLEARMSSTIPAPTISGTQPVAGVDTFAAEMEGMGTYGPAPRSKTPFLIIIGIIVGLVIIGIIVFISTRRSQPRQPAVNLNPEPTQQVIPPPTSGPATPPPNYVTIEKQCYSFAIYEVNTIPSDQSCSFKDVTYGKLAISKISIQTTTQAYENLRAYVDSIKPTLTVLSEEDVKLDGFDAKKIIYKGIDGKIYSKILTLITGKNYQQDAKTVTALEITISYQEEFDKEVTNNVINTWRWK